MTLADRGRFCGDCRKVVRELAQMSESEARALLASPSIEGLCVRYVHDATGEIVFREGGGVVPLARLSRKVAAAAFALGLPLASAACGGGPEHVMGEPPAMAVMMGAPPVPPPPASDAGAPAASPPIDYPIPL